MWVAGSFSVIIIRIHVCFMSFKNGERKKVGSERAESKEGRAESAKQEEKEERDRREEI